MFSWTNRKGFFRSVLLIILLIKICIRSTETSHVVSMVRLLNILLFVVSKFMFQKCVYKIK